MASLFVAHPPCFHSFGRMGRTVPLFLGGLIAHGMRNEMHFRLKDLHRLVQCSRFLLAREQKYLCLLEAGESGKMLSGQITDELKLVAYPVGRGDKVCIYNLRDQILAFIAYYTRTIAKPIKWTCTGLV